MQFEIYFYPSSQIKSKLNQLYFQQLDNFLYHLPKNTLRESNIPSPSNALLKDCQARSFALANAEVKVCLLYSNNFLTTYLQNWKELILYLLPIANGSSKPEPHQIVYTRHTLLKINLT